MFNKKRGAYIFFFIISFFLAQTASASGFQIIEIRTRGDDSAYDEFVKIKNTSSTPISILGFKLQSRSASSDKWISRSGDGLPDISVASGETAILASSLYSGSDDVWRHTARWGFADDGGGVRLLNAENVVVTEKYWGSLDSSSPPPSIEEAPSVEEPQVDPEPTPEPAPEPKPIDVEDEITGLATESTRDQDDLLASKSPNYSTATITISEFMPDPTGSDDGEWIEIKNFGEYPVNMSGWKIDDEDGGSKPFQIIENTIIPPHGFLVLYKTQTKIALNNDDDSVRLLNPLDEIFQEISYLDNTAGVSYALSGNVWGWTTSPTPSTENIISMPQIKITTPSSSSKTYQTTNYKISDINNIRELPKDTNVTITGTVVAPPGILGVQIFYIDGMQIYMYSKDFPDLALGDEIQISGTLSEISNETRIKIKNREDIASLSQNNEVTPRSIHVEEIGEDLEGSLVKISGEVIEIINNGFYLMDEEGNEIKIYFKTYTGLAPSLVKPGDGIDITGIVSQTNTGYRLLPRYESDIVIKEQNLEADNEGGITKGLSPYIKYFGVFAGGLFAMMGIRVYKNRKLKIK